MKSRSKYTAIGCITHGTNLLSQTKPEQLPEICERKKINTIALTDVGNLAMVVQYFKVMRSAGLKPIIGCQLNITADYASVRSSENNARRKLTILARNMSGWKKLLRIIYECNSPARYTDVPRISLSELKPLIINDDDLVVYAGHHFEDAILIGLNKICPNFFVSLNPIENRGSVKRLRALDIPCVAITPNHYINKSDRHNNQILLCSFFKTNLSKDNNELHPVFAKNNYHIHSLSEMSKLFTDDELDNNDRVFDMVEEFDITQAQVLPKYTCPNGESQQVYLRDLCYKGLADKDINEHKYKTRLDYELDMIHQGGMEGYFLIIADFVNYARQEGILVGAGRGSAGGCLVSYLLNITQIDPLEYGLIFERFYTPDRGSIPDIDLDFPPDKRDHIVKYIKLKYGTDNFMQLCTFNTLKGAAALKRCLSVSRKNIGFMEQNQITQNMPLESKIASDLNDQKTSSGTDSMVYWCINNMEDVFSNWCDSKYEGIYGEEFKSAVELDQVIQSRGRHACAFALSNKPLYEIAPVIYDPVSKSHIVGVNMDDAESLGLIKIDLLGVDLLTKCQEMVEIVKNGYC